MLNARQPFCAQRPGSRDAQGRGGRWEVEETLWVVKLVLAGIVLVLFSIQSASPQFSQSQFLQIQVDVSGGSGRPTDDSDPIDGGNGGTIEIQTGIDVDGGDGSGHILSGTRRLQNGVHQFESVTKQAVITIAGDDVVIKCRNRFVPQKIIGEYTPGGPIPKVTIFVGQGANSDPPFPPFDGMAVLLTPFDDSGTPIMDSRGRAFSGGTFRLFTGWTNAIYPSTLKAVGGNGVAGGRGGRGGTVKISSFQQGAASAYLVGVDGGMGGGFAAFVQSKNLGSAGAGGDGGEKRSRWGQIHILDKRNVPTWVSRPTTVSKSAFRNSH